MVFCKIVKVYQKEFYLNSIHPVLFFELLVVILILTWKKINIERKMEMIENFGQRRIEFLIKSNSPLNDPGSYLPQFSVARECLKKNSALFN